MGDLVIMFGWVAAAALACFATGWYIGRNRERQRIERRVALALRQMESRHKKELNNFQVIVARQAQELNEVRMKTKLHEAAGRLALAHAMKDSAAHDEHPDSDTLVWPVVTTLSLVPLSPATPRHTG